MQRTSVSLLIGLAVLAAAIGWLGEIALAQSGLPTIDPPITFTLALVVIAALVIVFGWPIRQALRGSRKERIDPFRAMRTLLLAKASSRMGALFFGAAAGILVFVLTRGEVARAPMWASIGAMAAAMIVAVCGVVVELWCRLPPDDEARQHAAELQRH